MNAEEFFKEYYTNPVYTPKDKHDKRIPKWDYYDLLDFAEAYNKYRVEEELYNLIVVLERLKEELLKQ